MLRHSSFSADTQEARLLHMSPPDTPKYQPAHSTQKDVETEVAGRTQQESADRDPFSTPAQAPARARSVQKRTAAKLSPSYQRQLYTLEQQKRMMDDQIRALDRGLRNTGRSHRGNYRSGSAILPRYGGGRGPAPYEYALRMQNDAQMMQLTNGDLQKLRIERYNVQRSIENIKAMAKHGLGNPQGPEGPALQQNPETFARGPTNKPTFNLEGSLRNLDSKEADLVRASPKNAQETIVRFLESLDEQDKEAAKNLLEKMNAEPTTMLQLAQLHTKTGTLEASPDLDPATAAVLESLTSQEKVVLKKLFDSAATLDVGSDFETAQLDKAQVEKYVERWQKAKTDADRMIAEGMLLLNGVDTDASNLEKGEVAPLPPDMRFGGIIAGIFKLAFGMIEKFGGKSEKLSEKTTTPIGKEQAEKTLKLAQKEKGGLDEKIKRLEAQKSSNPSLSDEEITKIDAELTQAKAGLKALQKKIADLEKTIAAFAEEEKNETEETPRSL